MTDTPHTEIIRRRVNIDFEAAKGDGWPLDKKDTEELLNALSFVFPAGEKFFIESVQNFQARITNPTIREQAKLFIYQEAMHSKEHARCNRVLLEAHPYGEQIEKFTEKCLNLNRRFTPKATQLAATCAFEHFTAMLADRLLAAQSSFMATTNPAFATLWLWHAVEETEHKAVCFDVYQHMFGKGVVSYLHRVAVMFFATVGFLLTAAVGVRQIKKGLKSAPAATAEPGAQPQTGQPNIWHLFRNIIFLRLYLDYYRPSFHPWNHDNSHLIEEWKKRYHDLGLTGAPDHGTAEAGA
jgi:predicted metal-dependent hydrolase